MFDTRPSLCFVCKENGEYILATMIIVIPNEDHTGSDDVLFCDDHGTRFLDATD